MRLMQFMLAVVGLIACTPTLPLTCGAKTLQAFVGQPLITVQSAGLPPGARIIRPGDAITEDYSDQRLNVDLDADDKVTRLWCG